MSVAGRPGHVWIDGRIVSAEGPHISAFDRGFQLGDGVFETLRVRGGHPTELEEHTARLRRSATGLGIVLAADLETTLAGRDRRPPRRRGDGRAGWRCLGAHHGQPRRVRRPGPPPARRGRRTDRRHPGLAGRAAAGRPPRARAPRHRQRRPPRPREPARRPQDDEPGRLRLRPDRGRAGRAPTTPSSSPSTASSPRRPPPTSSSSAASVSRRRPSPARSCPARRARGSSAGASGSGSVPDEGWLTVGDLAGADEAFLCSSVAGILPVTRLRRCADRHGPAGAMDATGTGRPGGLHRRRGTRVTAA